MRWFTTGREQVICRKTSSNLVGFTTVHSTFTNQHRQDVCVHIYKLEDLLER